MSEQALEQFAARRAAQEKDKPKRTFEFEGERLIVRASIVPEVLLRRFALDGMTYEQVLQRIDETALACLEPESAKAWAKLRSPDHSPPLNLDAMTWLCDHIMGIAAGLPTERPADSSDGPPATQPSSRAGSSSRAATRRR